MNSYKSLKQKIKSKKAKICVVGLGYVGLPLAEAFGKKGYFVYGDKKNWARDGDRVKAELVEFKWKTEAIVVKVFETEDELVEGRYQDRDRFGFVITDENKKEDIYIAWSRKNGARDDDQVEVKIIKRRGKNPEWVVTRILN